VYVFFAQRQACRLREIPGGNMFSSAEMNNIPAYFIPKIGQVVSTPAVNDRPITWYLVTDQDNLLVIFIV
jgi:hypothetical protein